jgi:hypothetical protein
MKKIALTHIALAATVIFSVGTLTGCDYCQPLALASIVFMIIKRGLSSENKRALSEHFAS